MKSTLAHSAKLLGAAFVLSTFTWACARSDPGYAAFSKAQDPNPTADGQGDPAATAPPNDAGAQKSAPPTPPKQPPPPSNANDAGAAPASPTLTLIDPTSAAAGTGELVTVVLTGSGFTVGDVVDFGGSRVLGTVTGTTSISVTFPTAKLATAGTVSVAVVSPAPKNVNSNALSFTVTSPMAGTISTVTPSSVEARQANTGGGPVSITLSGTGFVPTSVVTFNGTDLATTFLAPTSVRANVIDSLLRSPGTVSVAVRNAPGVVSAPANFTILPARTNGGGTGLACSQIGLTPGYCLTTGNFAGYYCNANGTASLDLARCPYGAGAGTGYATCADAGVSGYGCVTTGVYAGTLCSNGYLYQDAACNAAYGRGASGGGGASYCKVSCATAGVSPSGCVASGAYAGNYCASDGCVYDGAAYGCGIYGGGAGSGGGAGGGGGACRGATCADYGIVAGECVATAASGNVSCGTDGCAYLGCN